MRVFLIGFLSLLPITMIGASSPKSSGKSKADIQYFHDSANHKITLDYSLRTRAEKDRQLLAAKGCKKYLTNQLLIENEKYDRLSMEKFYPKSRLKGARRGIKGEMSRQLKKTMDLLSQTEAVSDYIVWLQS